MDDHAKMSAPGAAEELEKSLEKAGLPLKAGVLLHVDFVDEEEYTVPAPGPKRSPEKEKYNIPSRFSPWSSPWRLWQPLALWHSANVSSPSATSLKVGARSSRCWVEKEGLSPLGLSHPSVSFATHPPDSRSGRRRGRAWR